MKSTRPLLAALLALLALASGACSFVQVHNASEQNLRVRVSLPDSTQAQTRLIRPFETAEFLSTQGGRYTITTLPDQEYRRVLEDLRIQISQRLFTERQQLSAEDVSRLVQNLDELESSLEQLELLGAACSGSLPDFETVTALISWDEYSSNWQLDCP